MTNDHYPLLQGSFITKDDSIVRFEIFNVNVDTQEDAYEAYQQFVLGGSSLQVPADEPMLIEWDSDKKDTIVGSSLTLTVIAPSYRFLLPLYTTEPGVWGIAVYHKQGPVTAETAEKLIWLGWLDTEFYEEPHYEQAHSCEVTLTFTDFGLLKRRKFSNLFSTAPTLHQYIVSALYQIDGCEVLPQVNDSYHPYNRIISTYNTSSGTGDILQQLKVRADNFTDEDGEVMTWYDVLESLLQPLGLRIEQRGGEYYVYDLNGKVNSCQMPADAYQWSYILQVWQGSPENWEDTQYRVGIFDSVDAAEAYFYAHYDSGEYWHGIISGWNLDLFPERYAGYTTPDEVDWQSTDHRMSVDQTYNRAIVTFSPYGETKLMSEDDITVNPTVENVLYNGCKYSQTEQTTIRYESMLFKHSLKGVLPAGLAAIGGQVRAFEAESLQGGADCKGVVAYMGYVSQEAGVLMADDNWGSHYNDDNQWVQDTDYYGIIPTPPSSVFAPVMLYKTKRVYVPNAATANKKQVLKLQIPLLFSEKYNPWEQSNNSHNTSYESHFRKKANSVMLQLRIRLYASQTSNSELFYYQNDAWAPYEDEITTDQILLSQGAGWKPAGTAQVLPTLIHYCKFSGNYVDSEEMSCADGMVDGGAPFYNLRKTSYYFRHNFDGLYIALPNISSSDTNYQSGYWLEIEVTNGFYLYDKGMMYRGDGTGTPFYERVTAPINHTDSQLRQYRDCRWALVGFPTLKLVELQNQVFDDVEIEDIEESGVIDANAADEVSIDTVCGCINTPVARGAYLDTTTGAPVTTLYRAGRTDTVEQLLIGTLYSQFAGRHLKLSGTARSVLPVEGLQMLTDYRYSDKLFLVTKESYNVIECESEIELTETSPDTYTRT